ncbi:hypothetical protein GCM10023115_14440 [Pontixanthobacter gangjinensis]|uniref:Uncharacterized protein n=1 Tax=Pontixanthobacter gangjinensis TaxID=1028742 RepID=A0A6I4SLT6_9SPHN|nr:hypothetical protein [Pontixanthobacter gangjinensis]MXO56689.1 hypothetical protein [Pontixanthobacter gangjinensis]
MNIFLSASVPLPDRNPSYFETADVVAIRDSVKALVQTFAEHAVIHFGGHPAITPLISLMLQRHPNVRSDRIRLYQSDYFAERFPSENFSFVEQVVTPKVGNDRDESLALMRRKMLTDHPLSAAFFIGGMEGVIDEYNLIKELQPKAICYPVASTGGAALEVFQHGDFDPELLTQLTYRTLFRRLLRGLS